MSKTLATRTKNQDDVYYQAMLARDSRFDGKFFIAVKTTGIYCRPICPARPKRQNVEFFLSATLAEKNGYRPCLRCRPEAAPNSPAWIGKNATVQRALKLIENNVMQDCDEQKFADFLGVSSRHLRRVFESEFGKTPKQIHDSRRLNFARKLIVETSLSVTEIAFTSGFASIRRFNDAFKNRFHRSPTELRRKADVTAKPFIQLELSYRPPFDWESLLDFHRSHGIWGVEEVRFNSFERVFKWKDSIGGFRVHHDPKTCKLQLQIAVEETKYLFDLSQKIRQMFDLESDPLLLENSFSSCKTLRSLHRKYPGLRLPKGFDIFEITVSAILGQLVSVEFAKTLTQQLVQNYGEKIVSPLTGRTAYLFPTPKTLSECSLDAVSTTRARKKAISDFAKYFLAQKCDWQCFFDFETLKKDLLQIKGIGPWTADYIGLRTIGYTDAFPASDLILKRALKLHPSIDIESFKPWRAYAAVYLWKEYAKKLSNKKPKKGPVQ